MNETTPRMVHEDERAQPSRRKPYPQRSAQERHGAGTGWREWILRELFRYVFGLGVLAGVLFVPLQMQYSWLPPDSPPVIDPILVTFFAGLAVILILVAAFFVYRFLWWNDGWVDRQIARHGGPTMTPNTSVSPSENSRFR
jgi:hypothetical protein